MDLPNDDIADPNTHGYSQANAPNAAGAPHMVAHTDADDDTEAMDVTARAADAQALCQEVDRIFSFDSLLVDDNLLTIMKGRKNVPVPIRVVSRRPTMRQYQPLGFVAQALKEHSQLVNIVHINGVDCIQRKMPFIKPDHLKATKNKASASPRAPVSAWVKPSAASGFEEFFAEGPLPPDVAAEEAEIYNANNTFEERLEVAVHRYMARRKFNSKVSNYFTKWMKFGGIDATPHAYTSNADPKELEGLTAKERKQALAPKPYIPGEETDAYGRALWEVDFVGVAKSFLTSIVPEMFNFTRRDEYSELTNVIQNFLRYLQYHRVCPEYHEEIKAALRICNQANRELPACDTLQTNLPGAFNTAASTLYGGIFRDAYAGDAAWAQGEASAGIDISHGLSGKDARQLFAVGLIAFEELKPGLGKQISDNPWEQTIVKREVGLGLEIASVNTPTEQTRALYSQLKNSIEPLGTLTCKRWPAPNFFKWDLPVGVQPDEHVNDSVTYTILLEETLLMHCVEGIKFENATVLTLEPSGLQILDGVPSHTRASFYTVLENELVQKWKEPKFYSREDLRERERAWERLRQAPEEEVEGKGLVTSGESGSATPMGADDDFD